jgi:hypothetical protein
MNTRACFKMAASVLVAAALTVCTAGAMPHILRVRNIRLPSKRRVVGVQSMSTGSPFGSPPGAQMS